MNLNYLRLRLVSVEPTGCRTSRSPSPRPSPQGEGEPIGSVRTASADGKTQIEDENAHEDEKRSAWSASLDGRKEGNIVAFLELVVPGLIVDAHGHQGGMFHGGEFRETASDGLEKIVKSASRRHFLPFASRTSQVLEIRIKGNSYLH